MEFCFVSTRRGSHFMTELLSAISSAMAALGHLVELVFDEFPPPRGECVYVVIPHEFNAWGNTDGFPDARQRARTIALCTENPGTEWFEATYELLPQFAAAVSINRSSAAELRRRGIPCEHIQLGYASLWDSWLRDESVRREIDLLYLGAADPRRDLLLAGLGRDLSERESQLLIPPLEPRTRPRPDFLTGTQKYHRLRAARVLLNLHRTTSSALEWMRFLEAICNGCVVVSEPCLDSDPLIPGEHFIAVQLDSIGLAVNRLLDEPDRLQHVRERAYDFVRDELPMDNAASRLAELAAELPRKAASHATGMADSPLPVGAATGPPRVVHARADFAPAEAVPHDDHPAHELQALGGGQLSGAPLRSPSPATRRPRRLVQAISHRILKRADGVRFLASSAAYGQRKPRMSVVSVVAADREAQAADALASVASSGYPDFEVLIMSQAASDSELKGFLRGHPALPLALFEQPVSDGVGRSLNHLVEQACGEYVFVLDATGGLYPSTLERLVTALDGDPDAFFAYPMVAVFDGARPVELRSSLPWEPERLSRDDWIDAMALVRRDRLLELDCFTTDPRLAGWEAFDLWCKCAEAGGYGLHIPQVLAWHRRSVDTMSAEREDPTAPLWTLMRDRHPRIFEPS
jgi:hypothetical protein